MQLKRVILRVMCKFLSLTPKTLEKERLKRKFIKGNKKAFDLIYGQYCDAMYTICLRYTKNADEAADILQDAFIRVYEKRQLFNPEFELGSWIKRIVINEAINHYRVNKKFELIEEETYFEEAEQPFELTEEQHKQVYQKLTEAEQVVTNAEIASVPAFLVQGKYLVESSAHESLEDMANTISYLAKLDSK